MAPLAEELTRLVTRRAGALALARRYPPVGVRGASGIKRDRAIAKAEREYYKGLRRLGVRTRRRYATLR